MTQPTKFRKRPVVIEAMRLADDMSNADEIAQWMHGKAEVKKLPGPGRGLHTGLVIHTLEGDMRASPGDWIIRGTQGEFYPCRNDIFVATYEQTAG